MDRIDERVVLQQPPHPHLRGHVQIGHEVQNAVPPVICARRVVYREDDQVRDTRGSKLAIAAAASCPSQ